MFNPIIFSKEVFSAYTDFLIDFLNFQDPQLRKEIAEIIKFDLLNGSILVKGPYISLNKPLKFGKNLEELSTEIRISDFLKRKIKFNLYKHQEEAFRTINLKNNVVISTGTGSGKTEAFLLPMLNDLLLNRKDGIQAIIIYPMNALANDQLGRIRLLFAGSGITFGRYTGDTPEKATVEQYNFPQEIPKNDEERVLKGEIIPFEERFSREQIRKSPPNVLITNYSQLEYLLLRKSDLEMFKNMDLKYIVLDEIHTYIGEQGSEVSALIKRLKLLSNNPDNIVFIGTSATIASGSEEEKRIKIENFAKKLFGVKNLNVIFETYSEEQFSDDEYIPKNIDNPRNILELLLKANLDEDIYKRLTGKTPFNIKDDILKNSYFKWIVNSLSEPKNLKDLVKDFREKFDINLDDEELISLIYSYLITGIEIKNDDGLPLIRPRLHYFVKGISDLRAAFENGQRKLLINNEGKQKSFKIYTCRICGQHYFSNQYGPKLEISGILYRKIGTPNDNEKEEILFTDTDEYFNEKAKYEEAYLCGECGTLHYSVSDKCINCEQKNLKKVYILNEEKRCVSCSTLLESKKSNHLSRSTTYEPIDITILTENIFSLAENPKIIIFTDNRQEASFLKGYMEIASSRFIYRDRLYKFLLEMEDLYTLDELTEHFFNYLVEQKDINNVYFGNLYSKKVKNSDEYKKVEYFIFEEFCSRINNVQKGSLEKLGLLQVDYEGISDKDEFIEEWSAKFEIEKKYLIGFVFKILDYLRRRETIDLPILDEITAKKSRYKKLLNLPEFFYKNEISLYTTSNSVSFISENKRTYPQVLMMKELGIVDNEFFEELFYYLKDKNLIIDKNGKNYLNPAKVIISVNKEFNDILQCEKCGDKVSFNRQTKENACINYGCKGRMNPIKLEENMNYDVKRYISKNKRFRLIPMEHTGQIKKEQKEIAEKKFKNGEINVIVATSTLELGIDIGDLDFILMRNVPPTPANYDQRVGRAGRRLKIGMAITYCGKTRHDQVFFEKPLEMIKGEIKEPIFTTRNFPLFLRHIHSYIFTSLILNSSQEDEELLKKALPSKIAEFLFDDISNEIFKSNPTEHLEKLMLKNKKKLFEDLKNFLMYWQDEMNDFMKEMNVENEEGFIEKILEKTIFDLRELLSYTKELFKYWDKKSKELQNKRKSYNPYNEKINKFKRGEEEFYTLNYLRDHGFLPGYNLVKPGISISKIPDVEFFRPHNIAIREATPYSKIYVNGLEYDVEKYIVTSSKKYSVTNYFTIERPDSKEEISGFHIVDVELSHGEKISTNSSGRRILSFDMIINFHENVTHQGGKRKITNTGYEICFYKNASFNIINNGWNNNNGLTRFYICPECGEVFNYESEDISKKNFKNHLKNHNLPIEIINLLLNKGLVLYAEHKSDVLKIGYFQDEGEAYSVGEAIRLGATLYADITDTDIRLEISYSDGKYSIILYEEIPGGSGYIEYIYEKFGEIISKAIKYLKDCKCEKACYKCLLNYWNQHVHEILDRQVALEILSKMDEIKIEIEIPEKVNEQKPTDDKFESLLEKEFYEYLKNNMFPLPEVQYQITNPFTRIDFAYPDKKVAIYLDGRPYHNNPIQREKDKKITKQLELNGWKVLRISSDDWNDEYIRNLKLKSLKNYLELRENS